MDVHGVSSATEADVAIICTLVYHSQIVRVFCENILRLRYGKHGPICRVKEFPRLIACASVIELIY